MQEYQKLSNTSNLWETLKVVETQQYKLGANTSLATPSSRQALMLEHTCRSVDTVQPIGPIATLHRMPNNYLYPKIVVCSLLEGV